MNNLQNSQKFKLYSLLTFTIVLIVVILILLLFMPGSYFPPGSRGHHIFRIFWWICMAWSGWFIFWKQSERCKGLGDVLSGLFGMVLGPVLPLTVISWYFLAKRFKEEEDD